MSSSTSGPRPDRLADPARSHSELRAHRGPDGRTWISHRVVAPLALARCFHLDEPHGPATVILQSTTGALVPGQDVSLDIDVGACAQLVVTTPGATLVHDGDECRQRVRLTVATGA